MLNQKGIKQGRLVLYIHNIDMTFMWGTCNCTAEVHILSPH